VDGSRHCCVIGPNHFQALQLGPDRVLVSTICPRESDASRQPWKVQRILYLIARAWILTTVPRVITAMTRWIVSPAALGAFL
jgi:hypothetical protein